MVTRISPHKATPVRRGTLRRKLLRDMRQNLMQFLAMFLLCALGTWVFTGLDSNWRLLEKSTETYFTRYNLSDFWVKGASFSRQDLTRLEQAEGVAEIIPRIAMEFDAPDLPGGVSVALPDTFRNTSADSGISLRTKVNSPSCHRSIRGIRAVSRCFSKP